MVRVDVHVKASPGDHDIDHAAIAALAFSPGVQRDIHRRADNVANFMRFRVGVKTGETLASIRTEDEAPAVLATAGYPGRTPQVGYQMFGTAAHVIRPRRAGGTLVFYWEKAGRMAYFKKVNHPGTKATRFVQDSVYAAAG